MKNRSKSLILSAWFCVCGLISCVNLDIPPINVIQDKDLMTSEAGMDIYMARIYSQMPFEDFKYCPDRGFFDDYKACPGTHESTSIGRNNCDVVYREAFERDATGSRPSFWPMCYQLLRDANYLLETLPLYKDKFIESRYNHYIGEAYFVRAYVFYALAKRYGGVPLVTEVLKYPENTAEQLEVPRSTEEETWNQVLKNFDEAIGLLEETSPKRGYCNKYIALGWKSEAMLYAAGIAKYNDALGLPSFGQKTNVRVMGFDPATMAAASKKYYEEAYKAGREIMKSGKYELYKAKWNATDKYAQYLNMVEMFLDVASKENLYIREYKFPDETHGYNIYNCGAQFVRAMGVDNSPVLDQVELYDGIERHSDGTLKIWDTDDSRDPDRHYLLFDKITDIFKNIEPRARAFIMLPGDDYREITVDLRGGIFTGDAPISPLLEVDGALLDYRLHNLPKYNTTDAFMGKGRYSAKTLFMSRDRNLNNDFVNLPAGNKIKPEGGDVSGSGASGPFAEENFCAMGGFLLRKHVSETFPLDWMYAGREASCDHHFVLLRYGEILLNVAEAAAELRLAGESSIGGDNLSDVAFNAIKDIRERAGADPLINASELDGTDGLKVIRKERRKELVYENKLQWDYRRWRTLHSEVINGRPIGDGARLKSLYPFYSSKEDKFFFDARMEEWNKEQRFTPNRYYLQIPTGEVNKSPVLDQQPTWL